MVFTRGTLSSITGVPVSLVSMLLCLSLIFSTQVFAEGHNGDESPAIGVVTLLVGAARLNGKEGVRVGSELYEGDLLTTDGNGHVHIRFVDNGLVSVRPSSVLKIVRYHYDAQIPKSSEIKLSLEEGVVRSISGSGAKAARDKFRLNTPIAAIGVRGTDFVVKAADDLVRAIVNEGAIVVAPFSEHCTAIALGPCQVNSVELTGGAKQLLELSLLSSAPKLISLDTPIEAELLLEAATGLKEDGDQADEPVKIQGQVKDEATSSDTPSSTSGGVARAEAISANDSSSHRVRVINDLVSTSGASSPDEINEIISNVDTALNETDIYLSNRVIPNSGDYVPSEPVELSTLSERSLVWGRWSGVTDDNDRIIVSRDIASKGRVVAVGDTSLVLYRSPSKRTHIDKQLGDVKFNLIDAQAALQISAGKTEMMKVNDGWLNIDFTNGQFNTGLVLEHGVTPEVKVTTRGQFTDKGYFYASSPGLKLMGAATLDGEEASYFFRNDSALGVINGATYWGRSSK